MCSADTRRRIAVFRYKTPEPRWRLQFHGGRMRRSAARSRQGDALPEIRFPLRDHEHPVRPLAQCITATRDVAYRPVGSRAHARALPASTRWTSPAVLSESRAAKSTSAASCVAERGSRGARTLAAQFSGTTTGATVARGAAPGHRPSRPRPSGRHGQRRTRAEVRKGESPAWSATSGSRRLARNPCTRSVQIAPRVLHAAQDAEQTGRAPCRRSTSRRPPISRMRSVGLAAGPVEPFTIHANRGRARAFQRPPDGRPMAELGEGPPSATDGPRDRAGRIPAATGLGSSGL